jgi:hypothetical protein
VLGAVDDAHAPFAQALEQRVLAELARLAHLPPQSVDHAGRDGGGGDGQEDPGPAMDDAAQGGRSGACGLVQGEADGHGQGGHEADERRAQGRARDEDRPSHLRVREDEEHGPLEPGDGARPQEEGQGGGRRGDDRERGVEDRQGQAREAPAPAGKPHAEIEDVGGDLGRDGHAHGRGMDGDGRADGQRELTDDDGRDGEDEGHLAQEGQAVLQESAALLRVQVHDAGPAGRATDGVQGGDGHGPSLLGRSSPARTSRSDVAQRARALHCSTAASPTESCASSPRSASTLVTDCWFSVR